MTGQRPRREPARTTSNHRRSPISMSETVYIAFCTCPDDSTAETLAETLLSRRLAACVNILPGVLSLYRWQDRIEQDSEVLLLIKTTEERVTELTALIEREHPYDVPEVIAHPIVAGSQSYLDWVRTCTNENA
jgi:periplasmic divalent cation tolerance protein